MKTVTQGHSWGCGVACVAYATQKAYAVALQLFDEPENAWQRGYMCKDLVAALARSGVLYKHKYYRPKFKTILQKSGTIVFIARNKKYPGGHYLIRTTNGKWMNPWSNFPRIDPAKAELQNRLPGRVQYIIFSS